MSRASTTPVRWIRVSQEMPDSELTVLIHCPISDDPVWIGYHDGTAWRAVDGMDLGEDFVDHWAALPDPPK